MLLAGVGLERQHALLHRRIVARRIALDHDERHILLPELLGHDAADPAVPANDEVVLDCVDHAYSPALPEMMGQPPLNHEGSELREGVERRADTAEHQSHGEDLSGPRKLVNLPEADRRHGRDGHVERVPRCPAFDGDVTDRAGDKHRRQQRDGDEYSSAAVVWSAFVSLHRFSRDVILV